MGWVALDDLAGMARPRGTQAEARQKLAGSRFYLHSRGGGRRKLVGWTKNPPKYQKIVRTRIVNTCVCVFFFDFFVEECC